MYLFNRYLHKAQQCHRNDRIHRTISQNGFLLSCQKRVYIKTAVRWIRCFDHNCLIYGDRAGKRPTILDIENTTTDGVTAEWLDLIMDGKAASEDSGSKFESWFPEHLLKLKPRLARRKV